MQPSYATQPSSPSLMQTLRQSTTAEHEAVERRLDLMKSNVSMDDYRAYLICMWGAHAAVEARLDLIAELRRVLPDIAARRRRKAIEKDLRVLGMSVAEIDRLAINRALPALPDVPEALGALYVLEGSTLGGRIIARHLDATLGLRIADARAYLHAYSDLGGMWKRFGAAVDAYGAAHEAAVPRVIAAAIATFRSLMP